MTVAPVHPSLPQNDTPQQQAARAAQLGATQALYMWTDSVPSLPDVPVVTTVPAADQPTLEWFLKLGGILLGLARNQLSVKLSSSLKGELATPPAAIVAQHARCDTIEGGLAAIAARHAPHIAAARSGLLGDIVAAADTAVAAADYARARDHAHELKNIVKMSDAERSAIGSSANMGATLDDYRALFVTLPLPGIGWTFVDDATFARLRVAGPNSVLIEGVSALPANFPLTPAQYAAVVSGDTLETALAEHRVFLCDYAPLSVLVDGEWDGLPKYVWQPMALFAVPPGGSSLVPVAIQCGQDAASNPIFTPSDSADQAWGWEMAKTIVQVADGNYHELFAHLAHTHLVIEAVTVATHRHLATQHPLWALIVPHCEGTLFINEAAATSLITAGGPIDHIFGGTIASSQLAACGARLGFDFTAHFLPADLVARNVADAAALPDYPYRDDALLVWTAIHEWARQYVYIYYADDAAMVADTELAAWTACLEGDGKLKGFGPIATRAALVNACTMILFTASAQHAAVNFPQKDVMAFAPAVTGAAWSERPAQQAGHAKTQWLDLMPPLSLALEQLNVLTLLGSLHYRPLGQYRSNDYPYKPWFQDPLIVGAGCALPRFQQALTEVEARIVERNSERMWPYPYFQPSLIPTSINI